MKRGLVLSGGGANGAYEVGVLKHVIGDLGLEFGVLCGTSVGALNVGFLAQYDDLAVGVKELEVLWHQLEGNASIYKKWFPFVGIVGGLWHSSWYDSRPLWALIGEKFDPRRVKASKRKLVIGAVNYRTGQLRHWTEQSSDDQLGKALAASSAFPAFFCPVDVEGNGDMWTDAGLREIVPVEDALEAGAQSLIVVTCSPPEYLDPMDKDPKSVELSRRCVDIMSNEVVKNDLEKCGRRNVEAVRISPSTSLGDSLDFDPAKNARLIERGYEDAKRVLKEKP